jgi:hypothetical protein
MAAIKELGIPVSEKKTTRARKEIPTLQVKGDIVRRFNEARDQIKNAEAVISELGPALKEAGLEYAFRHNVDHNTDEKAQISSVKLEEFDTKKDALESAERVMFTWSKRNLKLDASQVQAFFDQIKTVAGKKADVNNYAAWVVKVDFDISVFNNAAGKFDPKRYTKFYTALEAVAKELGVNCPLDTSKVFQPLKDFHSRRFKDFTTEQNLRIAEVMPTSTELESLRPEETAE